MLILRPNPHLAVIEFTVNKFVSVRQGAMMLTAGSPPDVTTDLSANASGRVVRTDNDRFVFNKSGGPALDLAFAVFSSDTSIEYAAVGLIIQKVTSAHDGGGVWDPVVTVGNGPNEHVIYAKNKGKPDSSLPDIEYRIYMLIRQKHAGADYPIGDVGVIDPSWINR